MKVTVIGAGLAGSEEAWQIAQAGYSVRLFEMKPQKFSTAHKSAAADINSSVETLYRSPFISHTLAAAIIGNTDTAITPAKIALIKTLSYAAEKTT